MLYCAPWPLDFPNHLHVSPCALLRQATALESSLAAADAPHRADGSLETKQKTDSTNKPMMVHSQIYIYIYCKTHCNSMCRRSWDDIIKANVRQKANQSASVCRNIMSWILIVKVQKIWQLYHVLVWLSSLDWRRKAWNFLSLCWDGQQISKSPQHNISTKYHVYASIVILKSSAAWVVFQMIIESCVNRPHHPPSTKSIFPVSKEVGKTF